MSDIFISYKREDQPTARKLADALERESWSVWWDPKLRAGEHFDDIIEAALKEAKCVIVLWSSQSSQSRYVRDEATYALEQDKLVPVAIETVELPFRFRGVHTRQLSNWNGATDYPEFRKLVDDISALLRQPGKRPAMGRLAAIEHSSNDVPQAQEIGRDAVPRNWLFRMPWRVKVAAGTVGMFLLLATGFYQVIRDKLGPPTRSEATQVDELERQSTYDLIQIASANVQSGCAELQRLRLKRDGIEIAKQIDSSTAAALKNQIEDLEKNIENMLTSYSGFLARLTKNNRAVVAEEFARYIKELENKQAFEQIQFTRLVKRHSDEFRGGERTINSSKMAEDCNSLT